MNTLYIHYIIYEALQFDSIEPFYWTLSTGAFRGTGYVGGGCIEVYLHYSGSVGGG